MAAEDLPCCKNVGTAGFVACGKPAARVWYNFDQEALVSFCEDHADSYNPAYGVELGIYLATYVQKKRSGTFKCDCGNVTFGLVRVKVEPGKWVDKYACGKCDRRFDSPPGVLIVETTPGVKDYKL